VDPQRARRLLGLTDTADQQEVRAAYRRLIRITHPDVTATPDAAERTIELRLAYEVLRSDDAPTDQVPPDLGGADPVGGNEVVDEAGPVSVERVDADTIALGLPPDETLLVVLDVAHRLGEVAYLDPSAGLVEVIVEFLDAPTSSVLIHLQGRGTGQTEAICSIEPLSGGSVPPTEAVTNLLQRTLEDALGVNRP